MTHEHDRLEKELAALRPAEPSAELAERIGARLTEVGIAHAPPITDRAWIAPAVGLFGALAAALIFVAVWWNSRQELLPSESPLDLPQPTLATALDETLPTVWSFRPALDSSNSLDQLLDQHSPRPGAAGDPVQTRGFAPVTMNLTTRLGEL